MRASGRSTLLMTRITGSPRARVLRSTNLVCGSGPSLASTSSRTPSTMDRPRSTSPPKSAWPGVSTMLMVSPPWCTAVFLARIVMPFSRSRSPESSTRSATLALARNAPDCHSIASTSVVLPWSTCATMATLRRSSRVAKTSCWIVVWCGTGMRESRSFGVGSCHWMRVADSSLRRVPDVLFLADLGYDHRIWADLAAGFGPDPADPARTVLVAAGWAAGRAVHAALDGQAAGLVLFQPAPDYLPPEARPEVSL